MMIKYPFKIYHMFLFLLSFSAFSQDIENVIAVQGVGEMTIDNDEAQIHASVTTKNIDADQALTTNNNMISNIISELNAVAVKADEITTTQFSFQPEYRWLDNQYNFIGYSVTNGLKIKVSEINTVGAILNLLVDAGATRVNSIGFGASSLSDIRKQALVKATEDALAKAQVLANATGVVLGSVKQIKLLSNSTILHDATVVGSESFAADQPPISPGNNTYKEIVNVIYEIEQ